MASHCLRNCRYQSRPRPAFSLPDRTSRRDALCSARRLALQSPARGGLFVRLPKTSAFYPSGLTCPVASLRQILVDDENGRQVPDERIFDLLRELGLEGVLAQVGGLDQEQDWGARISSREQATAGLCSNSSRGAAFRPSGSGGATLGSEQVQQILRMLSER